MISISQIFGSLTRAFRPLLAIAALALLTACASMSSNQLHGFEFNARQDSPDIMVLAFRYGEGQFALLDENEARAARRGAQMPLQTVGVGGFIQRGDTLYVKWKIKATGEILEDTVDLKSRLPRDITKHDIYFRINGRQLVVFLITPERRPANMPPIGPSKSDYRKTYQIYPGQPDYSK